jgi:predicted XRE-type DNA-binding protein
VNLLTQGDASTYHLRMMQERIDYQSLARAVLDRGMTTAALGRAIGLSQPSVSRLATGKVRNLSAEAGVRLIKLAGGVVSVPTAEQLAIPPAEGNA